MEMYDLQERNCPGDYPSGTMHEDSYYNILLLVFCCGGKFTLTIIIRFKCRENYWFIHQLCFVSAPEKMYFSPQRHSSQGPDCTEGIIRSASLYLRTKTEPIIYLFILSLNLTRQQHPLPMPMLRSLLSSKNTCGRHSLSC